MDHCDHGGRSPLWAAASMGHAPVVALLLFWGCCIDSMDAEGRTVLSVAAAQGKSCRSISNNLMHLNPLCSGMCHIVLGYFQVLFYA